MRTRPNHLAGFGEKIKEKYNYVVNYEAYVCQKLTKIHLESKQQLRRAAKTIADYLDEQSNYFDMRRKMIKQAKSLNMKVPHLKEFKSLYEQSVIRDKKAHVIWTEYGDQLAHVDLINFQKDKVQKAAERHERYLTIADLAEQKSNIPLSEQLIQRSNKIDLKQDKVHVIQLGAQFNKKPNELFEQIKTAQRSHKQSLLNQLKTEYPILAEYNKIMAERSKITGLKAEKLDELLFVKARELTQNKKLYPQLQHNFPKFAQSLSIRIKNHELSVDRDY